MNNINKMLLESVVNNDIKTAKKCVKTLLENNNNKCDQFTKDKLLNKLNLSYKNEMKIPQDIKRFIEIEMVEFTFDEKRYVISENDKEIVNQIINTYKVNDKLTEYNIKYLNSLLLYGKSGCGKTMLGKYIAYKLRLPFVYINFSNLISSYLGETGENMQKIFNYISDKKCVFMIDELDAIGVKRGIDNVSELSRIVINIMQCLDKCCNNLIIISATNRIDIIDEALKRRFSLKHEVLPPDEKTSFKIIKSFLNTIPNIDYKDEDIAQFLSNISEKTCANITNKLINRIVECLINNQKITLM